MYGTSQKLPDRSIVDEVCKLYMDVTTQVLPEASKKQD